MELKRRAKRALLIGLFTAATGAADLKDLEKTLFDRLAQKSSETVDVTLNQNTLRLAANFLSSSNDQDMAHIKKLISGLKSVTVHSFEFKKKGEYTTADLDAIRGAVNLASWDRIVSVRNKADGDNADVYILPGKDKPAGLFIIAAEPLQLTVVYIDGQVDLNDLSALEGFGVPTITKDGKVEKPKEKDEK